VKKNCAAANAIQCGGTTITSVVIPTGLTAGTFRVRTKDAGTASSERIKALADGRRPDGTGLQLEGRALRRRGRGRDGRSN
jgi:hypothetical protein